jgi:hypothetical protein
MPNLYLQPFYPTVATMRERSATCAAQLQGARLSAVPISIHMEQHRRHVIIYSSASASEQTRQAQRRTRQRSLVASGTAAAARRCCNQRCRLVQPLLLHQQPRLRLYRNSKAALQLRAPGESMCVQQCDACSWSACTVASAMCVCVCGHSSSSSRVLQKGWLTSFLTLLTTSLRKATAEGQQCRHTVEHEMNECGAVHAGVTGERNSVVLSR